MEIRVAGVLGGGAAFVFIMFSFVAASRVDTVPPRALEPLVFENYEDDHAVELIKYGESQAVDAFDVHDPPLQDAPKDEASVDQQLLHTGFQLPPISEEKVYEFDELPESKLGLSLGEKDTYHPPKTQESDEEILTKMLDESLFRKSAKESQPELEADPSDKPVVANNWVEESAKIMAYDAAAGEYGEINNTRTVNEERPYKKPVITEGIPGFRMRTRYKVLDATSGEHYGTYYGDEGYSTLDPVSLTGLLSSRLVAGELRIVKLDWSNFDEIEVHIKIEELMPIDQDVTAKSGTRKKGISPGSGRGPEMEPVSDFVKTPQKDEPTGGTGMDKAVSAAISSGPRYMIYDRRTIQPMGEYVPEGDRSRIDRLTLYKMFPEYDFKTFEIDSIRWETDEVRIFVKGEKK
jgi:hypothetical protein